ncbi:MAG TPA: hypothetical protein VLT33_19200, partial [Labilithrix sp.]|nr:hypothetical protein [Labilithrix sp.]
MSSCVGDHTPAWWGRERSRATFVDAGTAQGDLTAPILLANRAPVAADLTTEGQAFVRLTIKPWVRSKKSAKDPTDTAILQTY